MCVCVYMPNIPFTFEQKMKGYAFHVIQLREVLSTKPANGVEEETNSKDDDDSDDEDDDERIETIMVVAEGQKIDAST